MVDDMRPVPLHEGVAHGKPRPQHHDQTKLRAMWSRWRWRNERDDLVREDLRDTTSDASHFVAGKVAVAEVGDEAVELGVENAGNVGGHRHDVAESSLQLINHFWV